MRLFSHFAVQTLSNTYLIGPDEPGDAALVDPAVFDGTLLDLIESRRYYVRSVLLTHCDKPHLAGLQTLLRIYDECIVYAASHHVLGRTTRLVVHGERLDICRESVEAIALPGHSRESMAYAVGGFVFTGIAHSAGEYGQVPNPYAKAILLANIQERILSLPDETIVMPFRGPPSTVAVEKRTFPMEDPLRLAGLRETDPEFWP